MRNLTYIFLINIIYLTGCGGGSNTTEPQGIDIAAVGVYSGKLNVGTLPIFQNLVVGPTGRSAIYYQDAFGGSRGFVDATVIGSGGNFTASLTDFAKTGVFNGTASGTYRSGSGVSSTVTYTGQTTNILFTFDFYPTSTGGPKSAAGSWNSIDERGTSQKINISGEQNGTISITYESNCVISGSTTFGDGANSLQLATLTGTASGTNCRFKEGPMTGLLLIKSPTSNTPSIIGHFVRQDRTDGLMFQSFRCTDGSSRTMLPLFSC